MAGKKRRTPPSAAAQAVAATMRRFDRDLSDAQIERIARDIDAQNALGLLLDPEDAPLHNGDEPATVFVLPE